MSGFLPPRRPPPILGPGGTPPQQPTPQPEQSQVVDININVHGAEDPASAQRHAQIMAAVTALNGRVSTLMATFDEVRASVARQSTVVDSIQELVRQLVAARADPAALDALIGEIEANTTDLSAAVVEGTPAAPPPPPPGP